MHHKTLIRSLHEIGAVQFGDFTLKSGEHSSIYFNLRKIIAYPALLKQVAQAIWVEAKAYQFDLICGVPYTALPIATCIALDHNLPMVIRRKEKKNYGTKQMIEGVFNPGQRCLIIEDVVTTGSSILETAQEIEEVGLKVAGIVALLDREQGGRENLSEKYSYHPVLELSDLLNTIQTDTHLKAHEHAIVQQLLNERQ